MSRSIQLEVMDQPDVHSTGGMCAPTLINRKNTQIRMFFRRKFAQETI
jgi:hypothetical protein